uniref:Ribosomal protein L13 n=1 Tax=Sphondylothamnion multifidum TaxID=193186 RepID=A0A4D6WYM3_9FLOR|nr:ribosomal protein L13 [Sphondylothamnion multifidum]
MFLNKNKTHVENQNSQPQWYIIDAKDKTLGRLSSKIAYILKSKNSITYTPNQAKPIKIIIINSKFIHVTGKKREQITYKRHSGRPGGLKEEKFNALQSRIPNRIIEKAIKGMLPKNTLGRKLFTQLKIYATDIHPHTAQKPVILN